MEGNADAFSKPDFDDDPFKQSGASHEFDPLGKDEEEAPLLAQAINHASEILDLPMASTDRQSPEDTPSDLPSPSDSRLPWP